MNIGKLKGIKMEKIIVIGGKGTAVCLAEQIVDANKRYGVNIEFLGFCIDDDTLGESINGYPILCKTKELKEKYDKYNDVKYLFCLYKLGKMKERTNLLYSYNINENKFYTFVHPSAYVAPSVKIGIGTSVFANCTIQSNVVIGKHNIIDFACIISHDTVIKNNNYIAAAVTIGSNVEINESVFIGLNSTIKENVVLEDCSIIGMGSNVLKDVKKNTKVAGNPAKEIEENK